MKKFLKAVGILLGAVLVLLVGYLIYLFASYHRIPDNQELKVETSAAQTSNLSSLHTDTEYSALILQHWFRQAYTPDFSFFNGREANPLGPKARTACWMPFREQESWQPLMIRILP